MTRALRAESPPLSDGRVETLQDKLAAAAFRPSAFDYMLLCLAVAVVCMHTIFTTGGRRADAALVEEVTAKQDIVDYGEIVQVHDGSADGLTGLTERGIECAEELLGDIRS